MKSAWVFGGEQVREQIFCNGTRCALKVKFFLQLFFLLSVSYVICVAGFFCCIIYQKLFLISTELAEDLSRHLSSRV